MDGKVIYWKLKERSPDLAQKIIFVTCDLGSPEILSFIEQTGSRPLLKPFTLKTGEATFGAILSGNGSIIEKDVRKRRDDLLIPT